MKQFLKHLSCILLLPLLTLSSSTAEENDQTIRLSLSECLNRAIQKNHLVRAAQYDIAVADAKLAGARAGRLPRVQVTNYSGAVPEARGDAVSSPDRITDADDLGPFNRLEINVIQPLYTFGKLNAYISAALEGLQAEKSKRALSEADLIFQVKKMYYALQLNRKLSRLLADTRDNFVKAESKFKELIEEGEEDASLLDFVKLRVGLSDVASGLKKVQQAGDLAQRGLVQAMAMPGDTDFDLAEQELKPAAVNMATVDQYIADMFKRNPQWQQMLAGIRAKEALLEARKKGYYPDIFLAVPLRYAIAGNRDDQKNPFVRDDFNFFEFGPVLGIRWEFSFGGSKAKTDQARAELKKLLAQRDAANLGLPLNVRKAFLLVSEMQERLKYATRAMKSARGLILSAAGAEDLGVQDPKELFESYGLYTKANSDYYLAIYDHNMALASLTKAVGTEVTNLKY